MRTLRIDTYTVGHQLCVRATDPETGRSIERCEVVRRADGLRERVVSEQLTTVVLRIAREAMAFANLPRKER